ncbi:hypothetical protein M3Y96_00637500 [Aphelenchoides besseyi]|nr:hypothetical protein M3Y96_00637500 [Aphelenchoides besseyi]
MTTDTSNLTKRQQGRNCPKKIEFRNWTKNDAGYHCVHNGGKPGCNYMTNESTALIAHRTLKRCPSTRHIYVQNKDLLYHCRDQKLPLCDPKCTYKTAESRCMSYHCTQHQCYSVAQRIQQVANLFAAEGKSVSKSKRKQMAVMAKEWNKKLETVQTSKSQLSVVNVAKRIGKKIRTDDDIKKLLERHLAPIREAATADFIKFCVLNF